MKARSSGATRKECTAEAERCGASVALVEETPWLDGMLTAAGVSCTDGNFRLRSGLFGEVVDSLSARYGSLEVSDLHLEDYYPLSGNSLKALAADSEGQVKAKDFLSFLLSLSGDREAVSSVKGAGNSSKEAGKDNLNTDRQAQIWVQCNLGEYAPECLITRGEATVLIDALLAPFDRHVDLDGNLSDIYTKSMFRLH